MTFLSPSALWLLAAALPIIVLYMLKMRRKPVRVSSTLLWTQLLLDREANAPWQKLRRNLLLLLQLLILAALVLAAARPAIRTPVVASGSVIGLLDASASMNAVDGNRSRFDEARQAVASLIDGMPSGSSMTLILVGTTPKVLAASESDKNALRAALAGATSTQGSADWQAAFALAAGAAHGSQGSTTVIVSDGGLPDSGLPALPGDVRYVPVGNLDNNIAITALALRPTAGAPELFAEVTNYSQADRTVLLSFYLGEQLLTAYQLKLAPREHKGLTLDQLPGASGVYKARISDPHGGALDALSLDDTAFAVYQASSARRVLLISKGNLFLEQLLASLPGIKPFKALANQAGSVQIPAEPFDLYVLDGVYEDGLTRGNLLMIDPPANPLFVVGEPFQQMSSVKVNPSDLTRYVDWGNIHVMQAESVKPPDWADVLVQADGGPLVFAGETLGRRIAAVTFDLRQSDLPLQVAYPILFSNLINYLVPPTPFDATQSLRPGGSLSIVPPSGIKQIAIVSPSGQAVSYTPGVGKLVYDGTAELGYYAVNFIANDGSTTADYFAVNLFDPSESDIRPRPGIQVGRTIINPTASRQVGERELWQWPAAVGLVLLLVEWQASHRKPLRLPSLRRKGSPSPT